MASSKNVKVSSKKVVAPAKKVVAPAKKVIAPAKKVVAPAKKVVAPAKKVVAPAKKVVAPAKKVVAPAKKVVAPAKKVVAPAKKVVAPAKKVIAPAKKVVAPAKKVVAPAKKVVAPAKKVVAPAKKGVAPAKKGVAPAKAVVVPVKKATEPAKKITPEKVEKIEKIVKVKAEKIAKIKEPKPVKEPKPKKEKIVKPMKAEKLARLAKKEKEDRQTNAKRLQAQIAAKKAYKPVLDKNRTLGEKHAMPPQKIKEVYVKKPESTKPILIPKTSTKNTVTFVPDFTASVLDKPNIVSEIKVESLKRYSDNELNEFRVLIANKLDSAKRELGYLQGLITRKDGLSGGDTDNRYMNSEDGTLSMEREQLTQMASRQITFIDHLEKALIRIENKTYGVCRVTGELISKERLRAVPHATLSVEAKKGLNR